MIKAVLLLLLVPVLALAQGRREYEVKKVVDGDTVRLCCFGKKEATVRLLGINSPETFPKAEPGGKEATEYLKSVIGAKVVLGYESKSRADRFGRKLYYVWTATGKRFVNEAMVEAGWARFEPRFRTRYKTALLAAEGRAKRRKKGVWQWQAEKTTATP